MIVNVGSFFAVAAVVIVTPGPDTALTIRNSLLGGRRSGVFTGSGVATGQATWALAASAGVATLLSATRVAFVAIKLAGVAYLIYLGAHSLGEAIRPTRRSGMDPKLWSQRLLPRTAYRQGLLSNLSNPKMVVFFISLLPQFVSRGGGTFSSMLLLGLLFCAMTFVWLAAYAVVVARLGDLVRRARVRRTLDCVTGVALIGLGARLVTESQ